MVNFTLDSEIYLHRTWAHIVGCEHIRALIEARGQRFANIIRVWCRQNLNGTEA